jgi:hypothetical protein
LVSGSASASASTTKMSGGKRKIHFASFSKIGMNKKRKIAETLKAREYYERIFGRNRFSLYPYTLKKKTTFPVKWKNFIAI